MNPYEHRETTRISNPPQAHHAIRPQKILRQKQGGLESMRGKQGVAVNGGLGMLSSGQCVEGLLY